MNVICTTIIMQANSLCMPRC